MNNKLIFILLCLIIAQISINAKKHLSRNSHKHNRNFNRFQSRYRINQKEGEDDKEAKTEEQGAKTEEQGAKTEEQGAKTEEQGAKTEEIKESQADVLFNESPEGSDKYEQILEGDVFLLNTKTSSVNPAQTDEFQLEYLRLNNHALYYTDKETTYRGVIAAVQLSDLLTSGAEGDHVDKGQCCQSIKKIEKKQIQFNGDLTETPFDCFKIESPNEQWELCFPQFKQANKWKRQIIKNIIKQQLEIKGIYNFNFITEAPRKPMKYSWLDQSVWGGSCQKGLIQSPAKISESIALAQPKFRLHLDFKIPEVSPQAVFDGQQMNIKGSFGTYSYQVDARIRTYIIQKIQFKFPAEHYINEIRYDGEMLIFGKKENGDQMSILSIMVQQNKDASRNKFIDQLHPENWQLKHEEGKETFNVECKDAELSLDNIVEGGVAENLRKSFFYYQGSYSDPPCEEGINRFVMTTPILVTPGQFESVKIHTYYVSKETNGNARDAVEWDSKRTLYYHVDKSEGCENGLLQQIKEKKEEEKKEEEEIKKKDECEDAKPQGKYIKAISSVTVYGVTDQMALPTGDFGNGLSVNYIDEAKVGKSTYETLQSKARSIELKNCRKKRGGKFTQEQQTLSQLIE